MELNTLFPGRENYTGPVAGYFAFLHHGKLFEKSHDVMERVAYVKEAKAQNEVPTEVPTRLHNMIFLPFVDDAWAADYNVKCALLYADYNAKRAPLYADYNAKCALLDAYILSFIRLHIPDHAWNGTELVFPVI